MPAGAVCLDYLDFDRILLAVFGLGRDGDRALLQQGDLAVCIHSGKLGAAAGPLHNGRSAGRFDDCAELQACAVNLLNFALDSLSYMAMRAGYGKRDLKAECEGKQPVLSAEVAEGKAVVWSGCARKAILRANFASDTPALTQTNIMLNVNTKNAGGFIVGGTDGTIVSDHREIALVAGDNEFVFTSDDPLAKAVSIELF